MDASLLIESQVLCSILMLFLLGFNAYLFNSKLKYTAGMGILTVLASFMNIAGVMSGINENMQLANIFYAGYLAAFGFIGYFWCLYCMESFKLEGKTEKILMLFPALIVAVFLFVTPEEIFKVYSPGMLSFGDGAYLFVLDYCYILFSVFCAFFSARYTKRKREAREYIITSAFAAPVLFVGILSILLPQKIDILPYAVLMTLIMVYADHQERRMVTDNLTKLLNRYGLDDEIKEQLRQYRRNKNDSFYIIVCDMDDFKTINDKWRHLEGDRALKLVAQALDIVAQEYDSEVFRIGGDEFVIITNTSEPGLDQKICDAIKEALDNIEFRDDYDLKMSMGASLYDGTSKISELIDGADKKLYQAKRKNKQMNS